MKPPIYTNTGIASMNNSYSVHVSLTNKHRELGANPSRYRVRTMDDKLNTTLHETNIEFDRESAKADQLLYLVAQHRYPDYIYDRI